MDKILILYSNPIDTDRIRLDKEHRALDHVLATHGLTADMLVRKHAATFRDLAAALAESDLSVFQFSGHGDSRGVYLEAESGASGEFVSAERIADLLGHTQPNLKLAIFMCCFSADAIPALNRAAPYLLTVFGPADDSAAIEFIATFYDHYLQTGSIEKASFFAQHVARGGVTAVLSRKALSSSGPKILFEVHPGGDHFGDTFLVDLDEADTDIERLDVPREVFLHVLSRKIRLHHRIFDSPRERAVLPVGQYVGIFSWENSKDVIRCHRILKMKPDVDQESSDAWAGIAVDYNENAFQRYRRPHDPMAVQNPRLLAAALNNYRSSYDSLCGHDKWVGALTKHVPEQYKLTRSTMSANLDMAERKLHAEDLGSAAFHLESALSAQHDLLDALTEVLTLAADIRSGRRRD